MCGCVRVDVAEEPVVLFGDPRHRSRLFGLFEKLDRSSAGPGMGLALVRRIVEVHDGRIWVESEGIGTGATFRFALARTKIERR